MKEGEQGLGWGNHLRWTESHSFCILSLRAPPGLKSPDLAVEGTASDSELLWFQETQNSLCSNGVCLPLLPPPLPSVLGREKKDDLTGDSK